MKVTYGLKKIKKYKKPVVVLGVFDGVHLGHRRILKAAVKMARRIRGTSIVITFWPHPEREESLYSLEHRLRLISELGIDVSIVISFNQKFARTLAEDFIKNILVKKIGAQYVYVGKNFRFGRYARGDFKLLKKLSRSYNFKLKVFTVIKINRQTVSSTCIRRLIKKGELKSAEKLLTRPVSVLGTVVKGSSLARRLGFPTANINPHHEILPPQGVYTVKIIFRHQRLNGVCNIGTRPTFQNRGERNIEVYIFNFKQNIYGQYLEIQFMKKIRNEKKFGSPCFLVEQIKKDILRTKALLSHH